MNGTTSLDGSVGRTALRGVVAGLQRAAFWVATAFAVVWLSLLLSWQGSLPPELLGGLLALHGVALLVGREQYAED